MHSPWLVVCGDLCELCLVTHVSVKSDELMTACSLLLSIAMILTSAPLKQNSPNSYASTIEMAKMQKTLLYN